jgi:hypothetical protein
MNDCGQQMQRICLPRQARGRGNVFSYRTDNPSALWTFKASAEFGTIRQSHSEKVVAAANLYGKVFGHQFPNRRGHKDTKVSITISSNSIPFLRN